MTLPPSVPTPVRELYLWTGKKARIGTRSEPAKVVAAVLRAVLADLATSPSPRPVAHDLSPDTCGFKPSNRTKWQEDLAELIAEGFSCRTRQNTGNSMTIYGDTRLADPARWLIGRLIDDIEDFSNRDYLRVFYSKKAEGKVEEARGERARILDEIFTNLRRSILDVTSALPDPITTFLDSHRLEAIKLAPKDRSAAGPTKSEVRQQEALQRVKTLEKAVSNPTVPSFTLPDDKLEEVYGQVLQHSHGLTPNGPSSGVAFFTGAKTFSISAAIISAEQRLDEKPTRYTFWKGYLYLSHPDLTSEGATNPWFKIRSTAGIVTPA